MLARASADRKNRCVLKSGEHSPEFYNDLWKTISNGKAWHGEIKNLKNGGGYYWVKATIVPFLNEQEKPFRYVAIRKDITERKFAEIEMERQRTLFEAVFHDVPDAMVLADAEHRISMYNPSLTRVFGYQPEEITGKTTPIIYESEEAYEKQGRLRFNLSAKDKIKPYESIYRRKSGVLFQGLHHQADQCAGIYLDNRKNAR